jgi:hypothetical protein
MTDGHCGVAYGLRSWRDVFPPEPVHVADFPPCPPAARPCRGRGPGRLCRHRRKPTAVEANITTKAVGYLDKSAVPASLDLVPAPPVAGSAALALDEQVSREARALRGSPRFAQAGVDAELGFPEGANHFSCAADIDVDAVKTPALYRLLERSRIDASAATKAAKNHYQRPRPFMVNGEPTCSPKDEEGLRKNGSTRPATPRSAGPGP